MIRLIISISLIVVLTGCKQTPRENLILFAGVGMTDAVKEIANKFREETSIEVKLSLASSAILVRQLESGAPADMIIFASKQWADYTEEKQLVIDSTSYTVAQNELVLVAPKNSKLQSIEINQQTDLPNIIQGKIGIGNPETVPAGRYLMQSLEYFGWDSAFRGRFINARDVRAALSYAELGEVSASVVFASDAIKSTKVKVIGTFPQNSHKPIEFISYMVVDNPKVNKLYEYITSEKGLKIWEKHGFLTVK